MVGVPESLAPELVRGIHVVMFLLQATIVVSSRKRVRDRPWMKEGNSAPRPVVDVLNFKVMKALLASRGFFITISFFFYGWIISFFNVNHHAQSKCSDLSCIQCHFEIL